MYNYLTSISLINFILLSLFSKVLKWCLPSNSNISQTLFFISGAVIFSFAMFGVNHPTSILSSDTFSFPSIYLYKIIYVFLTIFLYLLKCPQSLILSALRAFCFCGKPHISRSIFLYFRYQSWLKSW